MSFTGTDYPGSASHSNNPHHRPPPQYSHHYHESHGTLNNNNSSNRRGEGYTPNLDSIDSEAPHDSPIHTGAWDTETDHLLSYFLGGDHHIHATGSMLPDFSSSTRGRSHSLSESITEEAGDDPPAGEYLSTANLKKAHGGSDSSNGSNQSASMFDKDGNDDLIGVAVAPPTPAMHFYATPKGGGTYPSAGTKKGGARTTDSHPSATLTSNSSSSSSLSSMAAALVSGGPLVYQQLYPGQPQHYQQQQQQQQQPHHHMQQQTSQQPPHQQQQQQQHFPPHGVFGSRNSPTDQSPISPAAMIGAAQETLMLPPEPRGPNGQPLTEKEKQEQHLAWLRDLNAMAKAAVSNRPQAQQSQHSQQSSPPPPSQQQHQNSPYAGPTQQQQQLLSMANPSPTAQHQQHHQHPFPPHPTGGMQLRSFSQQHGGQFPMMAGYPHPNMMYANPSVAVLHQSAASVSKPKPTQEESEEKRAKRLERNRESARKSRRRKKERLTTLEAQVNKLHNQIEQERKKQLNLMVPNMERVRTDKVLHLMKPFAEGVDDGGMRAVFAGTCNATELIHVLRRTGPLSEISQAILEFQYNLLRQMILPRYQRMLLWLTVHDEAYFLAGKDEYNKRDPGKQLIKASSGRISSKQIGDDLTNGARSDKNSGPTPPARADGRDDQDGSGGGKPNQTSYAFDAARMWPLFCYEVSFSVDQEEKFIATQKRLKEMQGLEESRTQTLAAVRTSESFRGAMESLSKVVSQREEKTLVGILTPSQVAAYRTWLGKNRSRCQATMVRRVTPNPSPPSLAGEDLLLDICRRLDEVLRISSNR